MELSDFEKAMHSLILNLDINAAYTLMKNQKKIETMDKFYQAFADNNGIDYDDSVAILDTPKRNEYKMDINEYIRKVSSPVDSVRYDKEIKNASIVARLEAFEERQEYRSSNTLINEYTYYLTDDTNEDDRLFRVATVLFSMLGYKTTKIKARLQMLTSNNDYTRDDIRRILLIDHYLRHIASSKDHLKHYRDTNLERYSILAAMDSNTCPSCSEQNEKVYDVSNAKIGVNYPPFHTGCRCTTIPYFPD